MKIEFDIVKVTPVNHTNVDYLTMVFKLDLPNEFILDNSKYFEVFLDTLVNGGVLKIYINFSNVKYIDSSGIGVLINTAKKIRTNSGELILSNLSSDIKKIFSTVNLDSYFKIFKSEPEAINHFRYL